ncbi:MAG: serine/threonine protein kinase [Actinomycetota bacterium]
MTPPKSGERFGPYRIVAEISRGDTGDVYRAVDLRLNRDVAIRLLAERLAGHEECRGRWFDAAALGASLVHRGIVPTLEAGEHEGTPFLSSAWIEGANLETLIARQHTGDPRRSLLILGQVAEALDDAHASGVVHGGLTPTNVLLRWSHARRADEAYVAGFGITRLLRAVAEPLLGTRVGSVHYLSPEGIQGRALDARSDVYLLGCLLYECLVGRPPFSIGDPEAVVSAHVDAHPPAPSGVRRELQVFDEVLLVAMAKAPDARHPSCDQLLAHAHSALARLRTAPYQIYPPPAPPIPGAPSPPRAVREQTNGVFKRRSGSRSKRFNVPQKALLATVLFTLAALALVVVGGSLGREPEPVSPAPNLEMRLRQELERDMGRFAAQQAQLAAGDDLAATDGLVTIDEAGAQLQLGGFYSDDAMDDRVALVVEAYPGERRADAAVVNEREDRGEIFTRREIASGLVVTLLNDAGEISVLWHVDTVVFVVTADDTSTAREFFDQLPAALRLGPL